MADNPQMPRKNRLRRVVIVCCSFARNLAYYRGAWDQEYCHLLNLPHPYPNCWRAANNNCIDMCVLEWCKLFADRQGKHHRSKMVTSMPTSVFEESMLRHLGLEADAFKEEIRGMRHLRDKFIAHLDSDYTGTIPWLDVPKKAVWFYHAHIVNHEANAGDLTGLPLDLEPGYKQTEDEARAMYQRNIQ
jgi:hypothetical protein